VHHVGILYGQLHTVAALLPGKEKPVPTE